MAPAFLPTGLAVLAFWPAAQVAPAFSSSGQVVPARMPAVQVGPAFLPAVLAAAARSAAVPRAFLPVSAQWPVGSPAQERDPQRDGAAVRVAQQVAR
jgi:hypothetical protein